MTTTIDRLPRTRNGNPRLRLTSDIFPYWCERIALNSRELTNEWVARNSMRYQGDTIFHYGTHFPLATIIRKANGDARLVLLNGDSWGGGGFGPSTAQRQGETRSAVEQAIAGTNVESIILPFSALDAAGIDQNTIKPIDVRDDRFTIHERSSRERPAGLANMDDPSGATHPEERWNYKINAYEQVEVLNRIPNPRVTAPFSTGHGWCHDGATLEDDGFWHWTEQRHWLGDSTFRARTSETRTRKPNAEEQAAHDRWQTWEHERREVTNAMRVLQHRMWAHERDGRNYGETLRLEMAYQGFSERNDELSYSMPERSPLVTGGRVTYRVTRWANFLSSFDYQERNPLYFLCELPHAAHPNTVEEAIEALKPPEVVAAEARGLDVIRQGDLFAIPTKLTKRQIRRLRGERDFTKRLRVLGTNHSVTEGVVCKGGTVLGRGIMRHEPDGWRQPDHARRALGDRRTWYMLVRNTVPQTR